VQSIEVKVKRFRIVAWVVRHTLPQWLRYLRPGFHPWQQDNLALGRAWLAQHAAAFHSAAAETKNG
jgi:predicted metal-dependent hydrolase